MKYKRYKLSDITENYDKKRVPLSAMQRAQRNGKYRYFGAQGVIDYIDDYLFDGNYILIAEDGENLKSKKQNIASYVSGKFWVNNHAHILQTNDLCDMRYLYYLINSMDISGYITGSAQPKLSQSNLNAIEVDLPDITNQKKIVSIMKLLDEKIELNNKINNHLLEQVVALYEHLVTESDWPIVTIGDIAQKVAMGPFGSNIKVSTFVSEGVPIISGNHLKEYFLEESEFNYITVEHAERLKNSIVLPHDIIFTHAGNIGQVAMIPDTCKYDHYVLSQRQFYLRCDKTKVVPEFLLMFFHSAIGQHELLSYANQTGVPSIAQPATNLKKIAFKCPPFQSQVIWQEQVCPLIGQYLNNRLENEKLTKLRDTLLPKLMSGELDVSNIDL